MDPAVTLREVVDDDLPVFFRHMRDPESNRMAAFTSEDPTDRAAFDAHWARIRVSDAVIRTVLADGVVVGHTAVYGPPNSARSPMSSTGRIGAGASPRPPCAP